MGPWIAIVVAVGAVCLLIGYWLGTKLGGHNTEPMRELHREHKAYKDEVRDHFQQVSATMTRMVDDYREMYQHVAKGAEKLADMHHETVIEPPPKPEAITQDLSTADEGAEKAEKRTPAAAAAKGEAETDTSAAGSSDATERDAKTAQPKATAQDTNATDTSAKATTSKGAALDEKQQAAGSQTPSDLERPQDAAIRAAAEDAAAPKR
ncbi:ZapG family protein [Salinicola rhizosphaerae]|uniref:ZapG family protein n=1 Tax=Salinicola rhizosphaerae TaxID=1443141 RepID=UPI001671B8D0|nr:DUF1043 family protein [Salinicola rhizosphaerae]